MGIVDNIQDLKITSVNNPIADEIELLMKKLIHKDIAKRMREYANKTYIICAFMHDHNVPIRCVSLKIDISDPSFRLFDTLIHKTLENNTNESGKDRDIMDDLFLSVIISNAKNNFKYPYSKEVLKTRRKGYDQSARNLHWEKVFISYPFGKPLNYENRMAIHYISLDTKVFNMGEGHNVAICCSILLPFIQKNAWEVKDDIEKETVFKFIKSPEKELTKKSKNNTKWKEWKNSVFENIVKHFKSENEKWNDPGFIFICRAGEIFNYSLRFIEHYIEACTKIKAKKFN